MMVASVMRLWMAMARFISLGVDSLRVSSKMISVRGLVYRSTWMEPNLKVCGKKTNVMAPSFIPTLKERVGKRSGPKD